MHLLVELLASAYVASNPALALSLQQLDRAAAAHRRDGHGRTAVASPVFDACLGVCSSLDARATATSWARAGNIPGAAATLRWRQSLLSRHFVDEQLAGDVLLEALAHVPAGQADLLEVADAVAASARFVLLSEAEQRATLDDLAAEVVSGALLERRRAALTAARRGTDPQSASTLAAASPASRRAPAAADDERLADALCRALAPLLEPRGSRARRKRPPGERHSSPPVPPRATRASQGRHYRRFAL